MTVNTKTRKTKKRTRGSGSIIQKPSGVYAFQYRDTQGKRITKSLGTRNRQTAETLAEPLSATLGAKSAVEAVKHITKARELIDTLPLPLGEVWEAFENTRPSAGAGTLGLYKHAFTRFKTWVEENKPSVVDLADINEEIASDWLHAEWKGQISRSTYHDRRGSMLTITKALMKPYRLQENPWPLTARIKKAGQPQQQRLPLSREHVQALLEQEMKQDVRAIMLLALCAGMRLKDAALLKWPDVSERMITYVPAKTKNSTEAKPQVPILPLLAQTLKDLPRDEDSEYVVPRLAAWYLRCSTGISRMLVRELHKVTGKSIQSADGKGKVARSEYGYHSLRHTFCTELARAGVPVAKLAAMAGDTIATVDKFYVKLDLSAQPIEQLSAIRSALALASGGEGGNERERLKCMVDELPISEVRKLLKKLSIDE